MFNPATRAASLALLTCSLLMPAISGAVGIPVNIGGNDYFLQNGGVVDGNDCAGDLGNPPDCFYNESPLIAKFDENGGVLGTFTPGQFASVDGSEFVLTGGGASTGTFNYTPGAGDPDIRYWSVKAGPQYQVYWLTLLAGGGINDALAVPTGVDVGWAAAPLPNGNLPDISHIAFFDTGRDDDLPEPGSLAILGLGLLGIGWARRRRS